MLAVYYPNFDYPELEMLAEQTVTPASVYRYGLMNGWVVQSSNDKRVILGRDESLRQLIIPIVKPVEWRRMLYEFALRIADTELLSLTEAYMRLTKSDGTIWRLVRLWNELEPKRFMSFSDKSAVVQVGSKKYYPNIYSDRFNEGPIVSRELKDAADAAHIEWLLNASLPPILGDSDSYFKRSFGELSSLAYYLSVLDFERNKSELIARLDERLSCSE